MFSRRMQPLSLLVNKIIDWLKVTNRRVRASYSHKLSHTLLEVKALPAASAIQLPNGAATSNIGYSTAVYGNRIAVGTFSAVKGVSVAGAVNLFDGSGGFLKTISDSTPRKENRFGSSVALNDRYLAVGIPNFDGITTAAGAVSIYDTSGNFVRQIKNPNPGPYDWFGQDVELAGDLLIVASPGDDISGKVDAGAVYIYNLKTGGLIRSLTDSLGRGGDFFGYDISVSDNTIMVGSPGDDTAGQNAGAFELFNLTTGQQFAKVSNPSGKSNGQFGFAVSLQGANAVASAPFEVNGTLHSGAVYVIDTTTRILKRTITDGTPSDWSSFGERISGYGDSVYITHAGYGTPTGRSAAVGRFSLSTGMLMEVLDSPKSDGHSNFGYSVDSDASRVVVGDPGGKIGVAYLFNVEQSPVNRAPQVLPNQTFTVAENSNSGTVVGTVVASDADLGQTLAYSIISGNTNDAFEINSTTGQIKVKNKSALDYETKPSFSLTVRVTDSGSPALSTDGVVTVNLTDVPDTRKRIESLFSTGVSSVNSAGAVSFITPGLTDPHFMLVGSPAGVVLGEVKVALTDRYPFTTNEWGNDPLSQYISPFADGRNAPVGEYVYQTQFDATGFDPSTIELKFDSYAFDNSLTGFRVNGGPLQTSLSVPVTVGFVNGINTIQFVVYNAPGRNSNPTGFRVAMQASGVVIPSTAAKTPAMASPVASPIATDNWILSSPIEVKRIFSL